MRKRTNRERKSRLRRKSANPLLGNYIVPTQHAIERYQERIRQTNHGNAQTAIIEGVKHSRLIALTQYGGREIRENRGVVFVCEMHGNQLLVITVLLSQVDLRFVI